MIHPARLQGLLPLSRGLMGKKQLRLLLIIPTASLMLWWLLPWTYSLPASLFQPSEPSITYLARDGSSLRILPDEQGSRSLAPAALSPAPDALTPTIPTHLHQAVIAAEDARFWQHGGLDYIATLRAIWSNLSARRIVSGSSTLDQQIIKISSPPAPRNLRTKWREAQQARKLNRIWSKPQILEHWLNHVDYGNQFKGCHMAALGYFNKPLSQLSLAECALLAALPQSPTRLNPFIHPQAAQKRQHHILQRMEDLQMITTAEHHRARRETLVYQPFRGGFAAPHATEWLRREQPPATDTIHTSIDPRLQSYLENLLTSHLNRLRHRNVTQAAAVILHNASGEILALAGSRDFSSPEGGQINGAWTPHSPGSALKPFTYLLALKQGIHPVTVLADLPTTFASDTGTYKPENYDLKHHGPVTLRTALASSLNIPAVKLLQQIGGPDQLLQHLQQLGLSTFNEAPEHYGLGLTLGNAPVRLIELTNAYATIARMGRHLPWTLLRTDDNLPPTATPQFLQQHCFIITDMLADNQARLLGFGPNSPLRSPHPISVKTGTSTSYRDNWALGFTTTHTVGVWLGNFNRRPMQKISGVTGAAPILKAAFQRLIQQTGPPTPPKPPASLQKITIDPFTARQITATSPKPKITHREWSPISNPPPPATPADYDSRGRALLTPDYAEWLSTSGQSHRDLLAIASAPAQDQPPQAISPIDQSTYHLDPDLPHNGSHLILSASIPPDQVHWSSPSLSIQKQNGHWQATLSPGTHHITLQASPSSIDPSPAQTTLQIHVIQD